MGGQGSGNWYRWQSKGTVEGCHWIDTNRWMREGILKNGVSHGGGWNWYDAQTGEKTSSISYQVDTTNPAYQWVRLYYILTRTGESIDYKIRLATTKPNYGGLRWWFICPLVVNGIPCNRRVGKIYLASGSRFYGCRHCYNLTYRSCQESDKRVSWIRKNPEVLKDMLKKTKEGNLNTSALILALKAMRC